MWKTAHCVPVQIRKSTALLTEKTHRKRKWLCDGHKPVLRRPLTGIAYTSHSDRPILFISLFIKITEKKSNLNLHVHRSGESELSRGQQGENLLLTNNFSANSRLSRRICSRYRLFNLKTAQILIKLSVFIALRVLSEIDVMDFPVLTSEMKESFEFQGKSLVKDFLRLEISWKDYTQIAIKIMVHSLLIVCTLLNWRIWTEFFFWFIWKFVICTTQQGWKVLGRRREKP